jgi:hypothetical protein
MYNAAGDEGVKMEKTTVAFEFYTKKPLTKEQVERLHIHMYWKFMLNRHADDDVNEFLEGAQIKIVGEEGKRVVVFDSIGRAYSPE